ncbi:MAG: FtsW/RodA/SpoVE family cell cycle protein [Chloroflexi bacterium]|nr:FtsW/RodA/SpoVE family cell cycle protein [Ktedonobacteraceae bacterium]MBV9708688.1 FtsW/RodA/SpoVE family cell cycle protein [Chloroflexota bacterium]
MAGRFPGVLQRYRWTELGLFIIPFLLLLLEMSQLLIAKADPHSSLSKSNLPTLQGLIPALGVIIVLLIVNMIFSIFFRKADQMLLPLVGLLSGFGVLMATRLGPDLTNPDPALGSRQLLWFLLGVSVCVVTVFLLRNVEWLERYKYTSAAFGILLVGVTLFRTLQVHNLDAPGHDQLNIGPFGFQPSELLKICIVIFFAAYLSENQDIFAAGNLRLGPVRLPPLRQLGPLILMLGLSLLLFLFVRELGLALLIYGIFLCMIYLGSGKLSYVVASLLIFVILGYIGYKLFGYVRARFVVLGVDILNWNGASEQLYNQPGGAYQIVQGLIALSSGGILGAGLGLGHPAGRFFVPVVQSDMVFTALGEEFGLAGLFAIIGIYLLILYRGFRIAVEATTPFTQLLAAGLTSIFALQTLIIAAGDMKFLPLTGIPLPFLSYGGSSLLANYIIIGILLRISYDTALEREGRV